MAIGQWEIRKTPFAVFDIETTGLNSGYDRIVEISIIRINPFSTSPEIAFDSLLNPHQEIQQTGIHSITQADVADAPTFRDVSSLIAEALVGTIVVSFNIAFDLPFLVREFGSLGIQFDPPSLCVMQLRPLLGMGSRVSLEEACREHGIQLGSEAHVASVDSTAAAFIFFKYLNRFDELGITHFVDLATRGEPDRFKWLDSFSKEPLRAGELAKLPHGGAPKSRADQHTVAMYGTGSHVAVRAEDYQSALVNAIADFQITPDEMAYLARVRTANSLDEAQVRGIHAAVFAWYTNTYLYDHIIDDNERAALAAVWRCLSELGWAPGQ